MDMERLQVLSDKITLKEQQIKHITEAIDELNTKAPEMDTFFEALRSMLMADLNDLKDERDTL
jgi:uncharacterized coiled-coil DUF342 family protein